MKDVYEMITKVRPEPVYIQIKCINCGHVQKTDKHDGKEKCESCGREIDIEKGWRFAKGDWG